MIKKIFSALLALAAIASASPSLAIAAGQPEIIVRNIVLTNTTYSAGQTVTGSFTLINDESVGVPDVAYQISLIAGYDDKGRVIDTYDSKGYAPVFLSPSEHKAVMFSYAIPQALSGTTFDLRIQAVLKSGIPLGWSDAPITITHAAMPLKVNSASLLVGGKEYTLDSGPTLDSKASSTSKLTVALENPSAFSVSLAPVMKIYDRTVSGQVLKTTQLPAFMLAAKAKTNLSYDVDTMDGKPGVYLGEINFLDKSGVSRAQPIHFRYIMGGDIVIINSVTADKTVLSTGEALNISVGYAGTPYDITTGSSTTASVANLSIKVYNEKDLIVGTYDGTVDFNKGDAKTVAITAGVPAKSLRADILVTKDGATLASYSAKLSADYDQAKLASSKNKSTMPDIIVGIAEILAAVVLIVIVMKFMNMKKGTTMMILFILSFAGAYGAIRTVSAYTTTQSVDYNAAWNYQIPNQFPAWSTHPGHAGWANPNGDGSWLSESDSNCNPTTDPSNPPGDCTSNLPAVTVNSPAASDTITPGSTFNFTGTVFANACLNSPQEIQITATFNGVTRTVDQTDVNNYKDGYHETVNNGITFSIPFTAPSTGGTYPITFRADNFTNYPDRQYNQAGYAAKYPGQTLTPATIGGYITGNQNVNVASPTKPPAPAITTSCDSSGNSTLALSWQDSGYGATSYGLSFADSGDQSTYGWYENLPVSPTSKTYTSFATLQPWGSANGQLQFLPGKQYSVVLIYNTPGGPAYAPITSFITKVCNIAAPTVTTFCDSSNNLAVKFDWSDYGIGSGGYTIHITQGSSDLQNYGYMTNVPAGTNSRTYTSFSGFTYWGSGGPSQTIVLAPNTSYKTVIGYAETNQYSPIASFTTGNACIQPTPVATIFPAPTPITSPVPVGSTATIGWSSNNAVSCTRTGTGFAATNGASNGSTPVTFSTAGSYTYGVTCSDSSGNSSSQQTLVVTAQNTLSAVSCAPTTASGGTLASNGTDVNIIVRKPSITWTATSNDPTATYAWSSVTDVPSPSPGANLQVTYTMVGKKSATVTATSGDGKQVSAPVTCSANVNVKPDPSIKEI